MQYWNVNWRGEWSWALQAAASHNAGVLNQQSFFFFCVLGPHLWHMEVPRLGIESELQLLASTPATATPDLSLICDLHHRSQQHQILNPLSEARDRTSFEVGLLDYMVLLYLVFWGTSILFFMVVVPTYIPTNSVSVFLFPHILSGIYCL